MVYGWKNCFMSSFRLATTSITTTRCLSVFQEQCINIRVNIRDHFWEQLERSDFNDCVSCKYFNLNKIFFVKYESYVKSNTLDNNPVSIYAFTSHKIRISLMARYISVAKGNVLIYRDEFLYISVFEDVLPNKSYTKLQYPNPHIIRFAFQFF